MGQHLIPDDDENEDWELELALSAENSEVGGFIKRKSKQTFRSRRWLDDSEPDQDLKR